MRFGIDFGTTHTVLSFVDRGNYPVVAFETGDAIPSVAAIHVTNGSTRFGAEALAVSEDSDWRLVGSFKRLLHDAGPLTELPLPGLSQPVLVADLMASYFTHVRDQLLYRSNAGIKRRETIEAAISVPANASSAQRFLTLDAFRRAGFEAVAVLNEPSAAGFEYAHRFRGALSGKREHVLVYDLGGGTFDASLIHMAGRLNEVIGSAGSARLGGDDFDEAILERVLAEIPKPIEDAARRIVRDECRRAKEAATHASRRFVVDLAAIERPPLSLPFEEIARTCAPLVSRTLDVLKEVLGGTDAEHPQRPGFEQVASVYVVGGASAFPPVYRILRERFGEHRVKRSPHPFAATAIGLAIFLDEGAGYRLSEKLTRHFGVWREGDAGQQIRFDLIFPKDTPLPAQGEAPLQAARRYRAAHNIGHFRYVECGLLKERAPDGDLCPWDEIRFPFLPELRDRDLAGVAVERLRGEGPTVEERYQSSAEGTFEVTLTVLDDGYHQSFKVARRAPSGRARRIG